MVAAMPLCRYAAIAAQKHRGQRPSETSQRTEGDRAGGPLGDQFPQQQQCYRAEQAQEDLRGTPVSRATLLTENERPALPNPSIKASTAMLELVNTGWSAGANSACSAMAVSGEVGESVMANGRRRGEVAAGANLQLMYTYTLRIDRVFTVLFVFYS
jgi:hypothetical protein